MWSSLIGLILITITGDLVTMMETTFKVTGLYLRDTKLFVELEKEDDQFFKADVPISYVTKQLEAPSNIPIMPLHEEHSQVYWAYSNLKHILMHSFNDTSRTNHIKKDIAPSWYPAIRHAFGIEEGPVTYSVKDEGPFSTATWDTVLGHEWDKVANGTAVVKTLKFNQNKRKDNFNTMIVVQVTVTSNISFKTMEDYRSHVKEHC